MFKDKSAGYTLLELMLAGAILSIGFLGLMVLVNRSLGTHNDQKESFDTRTQLVFAELMFKNTLGLAVDVSTSALTDNNFSTTGTQGRVSDYDSDLEDNNWRTIAVFLREAGVNSRTPLASRFKQTAIYYKPAEKDKSGVLVFDLGNNPNGTLSPDTSSGDRPEEDIVIDRIVDFKIKKGHSVDGHLKDVEVSLTLRHQRKGTPTWCSQFSIENGTCVSYADSLFKNIKHSFRVSLDNNSDFSGSDVFNKANYRFMPFVRK